MKKALNMLFSEKAVWLTGALLICFPALGLVFNRGAGLGRPWLVLLIILFFAELCVHCRRRFNIVRRGIASFEPYKASEIYSFISETDPSDKISSSLKKYNVSSNELSGTKVFSAVRYAYFAYGEIIAYVGAAIILIGIVAGYLTGVSGSLAVNEGSSNRVLILSDRVEKKLPFNVFLKDFDARYYKDTYITKESQAALTMTDSKGRPSDMSVYSGSTAEYEGYRIALINHGFYANPKVVFRLITGTGTRLKHISRGFGKKFMIPGTRLTAEVIDFAPSLGQDGHGKLINYNSMMLNPAILIAVYAPNGNFLGNKWVFRNFPESGDLRAFKVVLSDVHGVEYSILSFVKDPARGLALAGFIIFALGLCGFCLFRPIRFYVVSKECEDGKFSVTVLSDRHCSSRAVAGVIRDIHEAAEEEI